MILQEPRFGIDNVQRRAESESEDRWWNSMPTVEAAPSNAANAEGKALKNPFPSEPE